MFHMSCLKEYRHLSWLILRSFLPDVSFLADLTETLKSACVWVCARVCTYTLHPIITEQHQKIKQAVTALVPGRTVKARSIPSLPLKVLKDLNRMPGPAVWGFRKVNSSGKIGEEKVRIPSTTYREWVPLPHSAFLQPGLGSACNPELCV